MMKLKAIPTKYKGVEYRSRLEARWAVFFDEIGIRHFYEHEGYQLESGWYLPDFYLPDLLLHPIHLEIKPKFPNRKEATLCAELAFATRNKVVCFYGNVEPQDTMPRADTYGHGVVKKTLEGPESISFDHNTLVWGASDLPSDMKDKLLEIKPDAMQQPCWVPNNEFLYWCECPCCHKITLKPYGKISPVTCGDACSFWHDEDVREQYVRICEQNSPEQFEEANNALNDRLTAGSVVWFHCTRSPQLLDAYAKAQKFKFW